MPTSAEAGRPTRMFYAGYRIELWFSGHYAYSIWRPNSVEPWVSNEVIGVVKDDYEAALRSICAKVDADRLEASRSLTPSDNR